MDLLQATLGLIVALFLPSSVDKERNRRNLIKEANKKDEAQ